MCDVEKQEAATGEIQKIPTIQYSPSAVVKMGSRREESEDAGHGVREEGKGPFQKYQTKTDRKADDKRDDLVPGE